jgi:hypothetical protein
VVYEGESWRFNLRAARESRRPPRNPDRQWPGQSILIFGAGGYPGISLGRRFMTCWKQYHLQAQAELGR